MREKKKNNNYYRFPYFYYTREGESDGAAVSTPNCDFSDFNFRKTDVVDFLGAYYTLYISVPIIMFSK